MRNAKLTILAALSLAMLAVLAWGYFFWLGLEIVHVSVTPSGEIDRQIDVYVSRGQFFAQWDDKGPRWTGFKPSPGFYLHRQRYFFKLEPPLAWNCLWGFWVNRDISTQDRFTYLGCPIWFAAIPCTIAPIAWLRRRRRREVRGFAVEGSEPLSEGGEMQSDP